MKAVVAAFNQEKALVGAFSVITNLRMQLFEALVVMSAIELTVQYKLFLFRLDTLAIPGLRKTISNKTYNCEIEIQTVSVVRKHCNI